MARLITIAIVMSLGAGVALGEVPPVLNHQGMLTDEAGTPLAGTYSMVFRLYEQADGGTEIWSETQDVEVTAGVFNVYLGDVTPLDASLFVGQDVYLGVTVADDEEMTPRLRLGSTLYSFAAEHPASAPGIWYRDGDGDGFGDRDVWTEGFTAPPGYVGNDLDCDDGDPYIHPDATEADCDGIDQDCDGQDANGVIGPPCPLQDGVCGGATRPCVNGTWADCGPVVYGPDYELVEATCDGLDNDCNGLVDDIPGCDDGLDCTLDYCLDGACSHELLPEYCLIGGICYSAGESRPDVPCLVCAPHMNSWDNASDGTSCDDGNGMCESGICMPLKARY